MEKKDIKQLYDPYSLSIMRSADEALVRSQNRLEEIKGYARKAHVKCIGIAHCISFSKEAEAVSQFLSDEFKVVKIDCKYGRHTKEELLGKEGSQIMCNPAGQAEYLKEAGTEINLSMGLCVGHDMVFNSKSAVPVSVLAIKDRVHRQNPMETLQGILHKEE